MAQAYSSGHVQYLFQEEVFVHEFPEAVCVVGVVRVNVELERVEVSTEKEQALRQLDVLFLEGDGLDLANRVDGVERNCNTQSVASYRGASGCIKYYLI